MTPTSVLNTYFQGLLSNIDGALAFLVADRNGVPIVKVLTGKFPESAMRGSFLSIFATATEQASKLGLSKNKRMVLNYPSYQVVIFNCVPLVVSVIATSNANTGVIMEMRKDFDEIVEKLSTTVLK